MAQSIFNIYVEEKFIITPYQIYETNLHDYNHSKNRLVKFEEENADSSQSRENKVVCKIKHLKWTFKIYKHYT